MRCAAACDRCTMAEREADPPERAELYDKPPADMYEPPLIPLMPDATLMLDERAVDCWGEGVGNKANIICIQQ